MTPTSRLFEPCAAYVVSGLSKPIVDAMSVVNELMVMLEGTPGFVVVAPLEPVEALPQAAARRVAVPTMVSLLSFDTWDPRPLTPSCKRIRALPSKPETHRLRRHPLR
jgi:hypothetical protein